MIVKNTPRKKNSILHAKILKKFGWIRELYTEKWTQCVAVDEAISAGIAAREEYKNAVTLETSW